MNARLISQKTLKDATVPVVFFILALSAWQATVQLNHIPPYILPAPTVIFYKLIEDRALLFTAHHTQRDAEGAHTRNDLRGWTGADFIAVSAIGTRPFAFCDYFTGHANHRDRTTLAGLSRCLKSRTCLRLSCRLLPDTVKYFSWISLC